MNGRKLITLVVGIFWGVLFASCRAEADPRPGSSPISVAPVQIQQTALTVRSSCTNQFQQHELNHITQNAYEPVDMYDSNGAGLAVNDLDNDGDLDLVLANLNGNNHIFWNDGGFNFRREALSHGSSRAVATLDVDNDGWLDIVFTTRVGSLSYWRNLGDTAVNDSHFESVSLPGVDEQAYAMAWGDLDRDGDLDLVTGSYDTALEKELRDSFMFGPGAGVFYYENIGGEFVSQRLAETAQALAIQLFDVNGDGRDDIIIGNDFDSVRDRVWLATDEGWTEAEPFANTTQNTMSFDAGDIDNDGRWELFAADMHPYATDEATTAAWEPLTEMMMHEPVPGDPQMMENILQVRNENGGFVNAAAAWNINYSGWSWSSKFGDLDQDGFVDLYIVNGMITADTFNHLPNFELVEENQVFRNDGVGSFVSMPDWSLNDTSSGRGMSMADLDNDGDLDIIINNLLSPAIILENQLCLGNSLLVDLRWPGSANPRAIGASAILHTSSGFHMRDIRVNSGYLSGDPSQLHFGFPTDSVPFTLMITWPDGNVSRIDDVQPNQKIILTREDTAD